MLPTKTKTSAFFCKKKQKNGEMPGENNINKGFFFFNICLQMRAICWYEKYLNLRCKKAPYMGGCERGA